MKKYLVAKFNSNINNHIIADYKRSEMFILFDSNKSHLELKDFISTKDTNYSTYNTFEIFASSLDLAKEQLKTIANNSLNLKNITKSTPNTEDMDFEYYGSKEFIMKYKITNKFN